MNSKQLQLLISAGVFSTALLSGTAYAEDKPTDKSSVQVSTGTVKPKDKPKSKDDKKKKSEKSAAQQGCTSANGCGNH